MDRSKRFTLFALPDRPVHSDTNSASPGSILARQQLRAKTKSLTFPPLSIARHSFIQLSQQGRQWRERNCPVFETVAKGIRTRAHLLASPAFYHWATAHHLHMTGRHACNCEVQFKIIVIYNCSLCRATCYILHSRLMNALFDYANFVLLRNGSFSIILQLFAIISQNLQFLQWWNRYYLYWPHYVSERFFDNLTVES